MSNGLTPLDAHLLWQTMVADWRLDVEPEWDDEQRVADVVTRGAHNPEAFRIHVNALHDLLDDESRSLADKAEFMSESANRWFETPEEGMEWLRDIVGALNAARPAIERTTSCSGPNPSLDETSRLYGSLNHLRADRLPLSADAGLFAIKKGEPFAGRLADLLSRFVNSSLSDREKADFVVKVMGPFFHTDLEAIEWAAEVARRIETRPRAVE